MKYLCVFVVLAICLASSWAAISEPAGALPEDPAQDTAAVGEKKTEKRGIYGFGHGYGGYGGYGGHGYGHGYGDYGHGHYGYGSPYYGSFGYVHTAPYYGGHLGGYYPYHGHGHYGYY
ncbi:keratin-associated protein 19-2 [Drosophila obscura]|uniref:keratin-associated protein 19-2 n=1 Tax=Drosophila obscura TaxID=7282 RepID=UPI000BA05511|nr:keratin-associated protein 19-2 [Drosophila obscura]